MKSWISTSGTFGDSASADAVLGGLRNRIRHFDLNIIVCHIWVVCLSRGSCCIFRFFDLTLMPLFNIVV